MFFLFESNQAEAVGGAVYVGCQIAGDCSSSRGLPRPHPRLLQELPFTMVSFEGSIGFCCWPGCGGPCVAGHSSMADTAWSPTARASPLALDVAAIASSFKNPSTWDTESSFPSITRISPYEA
eukprot:826140-Rhodomonas_salina.1